MVYLVKGSGQASDPAGSWYAWQRHGERLLVDLICPRCKKSFFVYEHGVRSNGSVYPSVVCPHRCGFHSFVVLSDWNGTELAEIL